MQHSVEIIDTALNSGGVWKTSAEIHTEDVSLYRSESHFWLAEAKFPDSTTNQKHYPDLGSDVSSEWNFCNRFSDVTS